MTCPARPRRALPACEVRPELRGDLPRLGRCVVTLGTFDGMHRGHAELIRRAVAKARSLGLPSVLMTFDRHPAERIRPGVASRGADHDRAPGRAAAALGVDYVRVVPFDRTVARDTWLRLPTRWSTGLPNLPNTRVD
ncbi:MAG TPA: hypothetical protein VGM75_37865 [Pseudonocardiaceae bacterium]